jgi:hypothetical protein
MAEFLVELYVSRTDGPATVALAAERVRIGAEAATRAGTPVRLLRSIFVPEDETCFMLLEAESAGDVRAATSNAGLRLEHVAALFSEPS